MITSKPQNIIPSLRDRWTLWRKDFGEGQRGRPMATFWKPEGWRQCHAPFLGDLCVRCV